jgi:hypothetical protein
MSAVACGSFASRSTSEIWNAKMISAKTKVFFHEWCGPLAYVGIAGFSGLINIAASEMLKDRISDDVAVSLNSISLSLISVSLLATTLQFLYARAIGVGNQASTNVGLYSSLLISIGVAGAAYILIDSSFYFKVEIAAWLGLATLFSLISCARIATLLINEEWTPICYLAIFGAASRFLLWNISWFQANITRVVVAIAVVSFLQVLYLFTPRLERSYLQIVKPNLYRQFVPIAILFGFVTFTGLGSVSLRGTLGQYSTQFEDNSLVSRSILFAVLIIAYASFPRFCELPLFSREIGRYFRQAQVLSAVVGGMAAGLLLLRHFLTVEKNYHSQTPSYHLAFVVCLIGWTVFSLAVIPLLYFLAHNSRLGLAVFLPVVAMVIFQLLATNPLSLSAGFLLCSLLLLVITSIPVFLRTRPIVGSERDILPDNQVPATGSLTVVIPSYNSGKNGVKTVLATYEVLQGKVDELYVIAVSDGSTDESAALLDELSQPWFSHVRMEQNIGKGAALREGFAKSQTDITAFIDADGDISPRLLLQMYQVFNKNDADIVFGSKWHPDSELQVTMIRKALSFLHHGIQLALFKLNIADTQVGIKMYRTHHLQEVLPVVQENGFSLDLELFIAFSSYGHKNFIEMPVEIVRLGSSTISAKEIVRVFTDMLRIFWRARISLNYDAHAYSSIHESHVAKR